mmetsp:Transcript_21409/g.29737  ORF Transcript_21409/g.29737 Transcript_21409/m.29737 type:complete len:315 (+) Transcript_21409:185-1129(+)|eukprot:CAMPEP_0196584860 /NCGR_PEP_ID=MMETSP1081-20130531/48757_1 /TAXON_ID=36882 /ORGANISM="Pyramimonas amylifera, Strain CCMP720" /LENGTH=314 /DNA_ID=CAMNT_0041906223 /DNA_START=184 /DNA_END=1128 /DNA_ORIENTATION=-
MELNTGRLGSGASRRSSRPPSNSGNILAHDDHVNNNYISENSKVFHNSAPRSRAPSDTPGSRAGSETPASPSPAIEETSVNNGNGFRNVIPRPREQRIAQGCGTRRTDYKDIEHMEKDRLAQRRGGHYRYDPPLNPVLPQPDSNSLSYVDELDRFTRDSSALEFEERQRTVARKNDQIQKKADAHFNREHQRWRAVEEQYNWQVAKGFDLKHTEIAGRNKNSVPYNPITLKYDDSFEAVKLDFEGKCIRHRAAVRANTLYTKMHSQQFNMFTGEPASMQVPVPERPLTPVKPPTPELVGKYHRVDLAYGGALDV